MIAGMTQAEDLLQRIDANHEAGLSVAISSPGGCGKTAVLSAVAAAYRAAGVPVWDADSLEARSTPEGAVLIDDAHLAGAATLERVQPLVDASRTRLFVAFRPWPPRPEIARLTAAIRQVGPLVLLDRLDRDEVERRAQSVLPEAPGKALVDLLLTETGGLPLLVDEVLASFSSQPTTDGDDELAMPTDVVDRLRRVVDRLEPASRAVLHAVSIGADLEPDTVSRVLGMDEAAASDAVEATWASGFLLPDGRPIPLIAEAIVRFTPPERTRAAREALMHVRHEQHRDAVPLARALVASGTRDRFVAELLESAADERLANEPAVAFDLYTEAAEAGTPAVQLAVRRAEAAARAGKLDLALRIVDPVLADPDAVDFPAALEIAATVMAHQGLLGRAADLYSWLGQDRIGAGQPMAALALLATGARSGAAELIASAPPSPTMAAGVRTLMAQGVWESIEGTAATALSTLMRASTLLESADRSLLLADTPAALTALVAIHIGDLDLAESALRRAIERDLGGDGAWARHRLLLAWVGMLRGRYGHARQLIAEVTSRAAETNWSPRDELFARALEVGIARRTSDVPGLVAAWNAGRDALLRHPVDLFSLLPLGEFTIAAARLRESERVSAQLADGWRLLRDLGEPVVWSVMPHWCGVQAAILNNSPVEVEPHATALVGASKDSTLANALAGAGGAWMEVLVGEVDAARVQSAARRLTAFGLAWDGSRLLGQAAGHSSDRRAMTNLLQAARSLQEPDDGEPSDDQASPTQNGLSSVLSAREKEVAELLVQGRTYREIGQQLFISAKTVEHHVARIKQRVRASDRSDLLARLRVLIDRSGD